MKYLFTLLILVGCLNPQHDIECQSYKLKAPVSLNSAATCYGISRMSNLVCNTVGSVTLCNNDGTYTYQVIWDMHQPDVTGDIYEFMAGKSTLSSYASLESGQYVFRRVDNNLTLTACSVAQDEIQVCD